MLKLESVSKTYAGSQEKAVSNLNLNLKKGEVFGFLGPNGAGKTTTLELIVGILQQDEGRILLEDINIKEEPIKAKKQIGYVPDNPELYEALKGIEYLNFIGDIYNIEKDSRLKEIKKYSKLFRIWENLNDLISTYSRGMKQKLAIISMLIIDPKLLILDEPMVGLDPESSYNLKKIMEERASVGNTVLFSTHVLEIAEQVCNRVGIINKGKIIKVDSIENIKKSLSKDKNLEDLFLELTKDE